jgi:hypothetical protein
MIKKDKTGFSRTLPLPTAFLEKPMTQWASGKIKRLYDGYESFCQEIGRLLGEPQSESSNKIRVAPLDHPEMIDEFELLWEDAGQAHNTQQLLTLLSNFYRAGFILESDDHQSLVKSYFLEDSREVMNPVMDKTYDRLIPAGTNLKPSRLPASEFIKTLGIPEIEWIEAPEVFHFWIYPDEGTSLVLVSDTPEPRRREIVLKTQALIQRRFYD